VDLGLRTTPDLESEDAQLQLAGEYIDFERDFTGCPDGNVNYWFDLIPIEELLTAGQLGDADPLGLDPWDGTDGDAYGSIDPDRWSTWVSREASGPFWAHH
jgi:hypothetical protein